MCSVSSRAALVSFLMPSQNGLTDYNQFRETDGIHDHRKLTQFIGGDSLRKDTHNDGTMRHRTTSVAL